MGQGKKKWLMNAAFLAAVAGLTLWAILRNSDLGKLKGLMAQANRFYWLAGVVLVVAYICCESWILHILLRGVKREPAPGRCLLYSFTGFFFCCITPSAGGGQPAQMYCMHRDGIGVEVSAPVLMMVTITYKAVLVLYGLLILLLRPAAIIAAPAAVRWWAVAGWLMNVVFIAFYCILLLRPGLIRCLAGWGVGILSRFLGQIRTAKLQEKLAQITERYKDVSLTMQRDRCGLVKASLVSILQRTMLFAVTWLVLRSFSFTELSLFDAVMMQAMVSLGTDLLPLPGGTGAVELMFLMLFTGVCGENMVLPVLLVTRAICFYGQLILSGSTALIGWRLTPRMERCGHSFIRESGSGAA